MTSIREVTLYSLGDSRKISTWSNVPYFFAEALADKQIRVNRVDLSPGLTGRIANRLIRGALSLSNSGSTYDYTRSLVHYREVKKRIRRAAAAFPATDAHIFLTFSFSSAGLSEKPCVLFGDWTYEHCFSHFLGRPPNRWELASVQREDREIEAADLVFALFPSVAERMRQRYRNPQIHYAGNVVNSSVQAEADTVLQRKLSSRRILFIGSRKYLVGARQLLDAFKQLSASYPGLELHIVGMRAREFGTAAKGIHFHGYLDKQNAADRERYYDLLLSARVVVNTTPKWAAFSAMIEAMYFYNPVVVTPYEEFVKTFGPHIEFGHYCADGGDTTALCGLLANLLDDKGYAARCQRAHAAVKHYTWNDYIDRLLAHLERTMAARSSSGHEAPAVSS